MSEYCEKYNGEEGIGENIPSCNVVGVIKFSDGIEMPGEMFLTNISVVLQTYITSPVDEPIRISLNLIGVLELKIIPHSSLLKAPDDPDLLAPNMAACLILTYLDDILDSQSYKTIYFMAIRQDLQQFKETIDPIIKKMKENMKFRGPNLTPKLGVKVKRPAPKRMKSKSFKLEGKSNILTEAEIDTLRLSLPTRQKMYPWKLLFTTSEDGVALETLFKKCERKTPVVLIVSASDKTKFGAYLSEGIKKSNSFYGTGECFVFTYNPLLSVYKWTNENKYFIASSQNDISVGNSKQGGAAIFIGDCMSVGFSDQCDTFGSPRLSNQPQFRILNVEVWTIQPML